MSTDATPEKQYPIKVVAEALGVHPKTVKALIASGQLAATDISTGQRQRIYRVSQASLDAFLTARRVKP